MDLVDAVHHDVLMTMTDDQPAPPVAAIEPRPPVSLALVALGTLAVALLVAVVVLIVMVSDLQDQVKSVRQGQSVASVNTTDPQSATRDADLCRLLGALAAKSKVTLGEVFSDGTVGECELAATDGFHRASSPG